MDPVTQALLDTLATKGAPQINKLSVADARRMLAGVQAGDAQQIAVDIEDRMMPGGPHGQISLRIVRPMNTTTNPAVIYFHGGGWVLGDADTHDRLIQEISIGSNATLIFVKFSGSPEVQYPTANEEAFSATQWVAAHGHEIGIDPARRAVAGDSAGGIAQANRALRLALTRHHYNRSYTRMCSLVLINHREYSLEKTANIF